MICFEMDRDEADALHHVIERYLYHLQIEGIRSDNREFLDLLKRRENLLKRLTGRLRAKILQEP